MLPIQYNYLHIKTRGLIFDNELVMSCLDLAAAHDLDEIQIWRTQMISPLPIKCSKGNLFNFATWLRCVHPPAFCEAVGDNSQPDLQICFSN